MATSICGRGGISIRDGRPMTVRAGYNGDQGRGGRHEVERARRGGFSASLADKAGPRRYFVPPVPPLTPVDWGRPEDLRILSWAALAQK
jgi:hypothetical protein